MPDSPAIAVATSLVPGRDIDIQTAAVRSWQALGFAVVSLNAPAEAAAVRRQFPGVAVTEAQRTAEKAVGRPLPFIGDLLAAARAHGPAARVVGVINADIVLRPSRDLSAALLRESENGAIMLPRVDVPDLNAIAAFRPSGRETYSVGYDGAFMRPETIADVPENLFCIGMPFWDYWLPLTMVLQDKTLKTLAAPVALHISHPTRWDGSIYLFFHALVSDALKICAARQAKSADAAFAVLLDMLRHSYADLFRRATQGGEANPGVEALASFYDRIQEVVVHHIKAKAVPVAVPDAAATA
jgi:hypothetical protein